MTSIQNDYNRNQEYTRTNKVNEGINQQKADVAKGELQYKNDMKASQKFSNYANGIGNVMKGTASLVKLF